MDERHSNRPLYPRTYDGWALKASVLLDRAHPGFLVDTLCASTFTRHARFAALAEINETSPQDVVERLRAANDPSPVASREPLAEIARHLLARRPRATLTALFGGCPDGLTGLCCRLGPAPLDQDIYRFAYALFSDPSHRPKAEVLAQTPGPISGSKLTILARLDPILAHRNVVDRLYNTHVQIEGLHAFLDLIRTLCDASDAGILHSLDRIGPGPKLNRWAQQWLRRQVRLPLTPPIPADDQRFQVLFGEALYQHGADTIFR